MTFNPTLWSVVLRAQNPGDPHRKTALNHLCQTYWSPVYAYLRRKGMSEEDARDATQSFFSHFLEKELLERVDRGRGRFRNYLLATLENHLSNERRISNAAKRGGGTRPHSFDFVRAETTLKLEVADTETPERAFKRSWALAVLQEAFEQLRKEFTVKGRDEDFQTIRTHLNASADRGSYEELATRLGRSVTDVTNLLHQSRKRLRELIRTTLRESVESESEVDDEVKELFESL